MRLEDVLELPRASQLRVLKILKERQIRRGKRLYYRIFPDEDTPWDGPPLLDGLITPGQVIHSRHSYKKHLEFFTAGKSFRERCFMGGNRTGKTFAAGGFECAAHLTGLYPDWWDGRRFTKPVSIWCAGDTLKTTRDVLQFNLLGEVDDSGMKKRPSGRGVVPGELVGAVIWHGGFQNLVDTVLIKHVPTGGWSNLGFKSYDQGRRTFQGTGKHVIWLDEECPMKIYGECLIRTATLNGLVMLTFTPIEGLTPLTVSFLPADQRPVTDEPEALSF